MSGNFWDTIDKPEAKSDAGAEQPLDNTFSDFPPEGEEGRAFGGFGDDESTNSEATVDSETVVDAEAREAAPKRRSMLPVIAGIGLVVLCIFGFISYQFVQKFLPSKDAVAAQANGAAILADSSFDAPLPGAKQSGASTVVPMGHVDVAKDRESDVADSPLTAAPPVKVEEAAPVLTSSPVAAAPVVAASPVEPSPVPAPSPAVNVTPEPIKPVAPVVAAAPASIEKSPAPVDVATPKPVVQKPAAKPASRPAQVTKAAKPARQSTRAKPTSTAKANSIRPDASRAPVIDERVEDLGRLSDYTVLAFEPKHGAFQQAWIREPNGKIVIVGKGDSVAGAKVNEVSFADGAVKTTRGQIR